VDDADLLVGEVEVLPGARGPLPTSLDPLREQVLEVPKSLEARREQRLEGRSSLDVTFDI
jgi:hypothetical protein